MRLQLIVPENDAARARDLQPADERRAGRRSSSSACIPLALGLIGYIVPLQIGARGVALPRLNQLSYWLYLAGAVTSTPASSTPPPETGTAALPPLSDLVFSPSNGADAWIAGTALALPRLRLLRDQPDRHPAQAARARARLAADAAVLAGRRP